MDGVIFNSQTKKSFSVLLTYLKARKIVYLSSNIIQITSVMKSFLAVVGIVFAQGLVQDIINSELSAFSRFDMNALCRHRMIKSVLEKLSLVTLDTALGLAPLQFNQSFTVNCFIPSLFSDTFIFLDLLYFLFNGLLTYSILIHY